MYYNKIENVLIFSYHQTLVGKHQVCIDRIRHFNA